MARAAVIAVLKTESRSWLLKGVAAGLVAGIPQVLLTQLEAWLLPAPRSYADIGPRFMERLTRRADAALDRGSVVQLEPGLPVRSSPAQLDGWLRPRTTPSSSARVPMALLRRSSSPGLDSASSCAKEPTSRVVVHAPSR